MIPTLLLALSTSTTQLGVAVQARAQAAIGLEPDLEKSTTDTYVITVAKKEAGADATAWTFDILPLAIGKVPVTLYWNGDAPEAKAELTVNEPQLPPDAEIADIKKPVRARPALWPWLLGLVLAAGAWHGWKRLKRNCHADTATAHPPDLRAPHVIALDELSSLENSSLWPEGRHKEFYGRLTDILRAYLERRFGMPALKLTTAELSRQLRQAEVDRAAVVLFKDLFERADLVKFAKMAPASEQDGLDIASARRLVAATAPQELAAPAAAARS